MKKTYIEFNQESDEILGDIFVIMQQKFLEKAVPNDVLLVKPDPEKQAIIACLAKAEGFPGTMEFNENLSSDIQPYFDLIKQKFTTKVVHEFILHHWGTNMYLKSLSELMMESVIQKVRSPEYKMK